MQFLVIENDEVVNVIEAEEGFSIPNTEIIPQTNPAASIGWKIINGSPVAPPAIVAPTPVDSRKPIITRRAFQNRFPKTADGVSTKYDVMTMFLNDKEYSEEIVPDANTRRQLKLLITTGMNRMSVSTDVDFDMPDAASFIQLLQSIPSVLPFHITAPESAKLLDKSTITPEERPREQNQN